MTHRPEPQDGFGYQAEEAYHAQTALMLEEEDWSPDYLIAQFSWESRQQWLIADASELGIAPGEVTKDSFTVYNPDTMARRKYSLNLDLSNGSVLIYDGNIDGIQVHILND